MPWRLEINKGLCPKFRAIRRWNFGNKTFTQHITLCITCIYWKIIRKVGYTSDTLMIWRGDSKSINPNIPSLCIMKHINQRKMLECVKWDWSGMAKLKEDWKNGFNIALHKVMCWVLNFVAKFCSQKTIFRSKISTKLAWRISIFILIVSEKLAL